MPKIPIDDKVTLHDPPETSPAYPKDHSARIPGSIVSNSSYSLRNRNQYFKIVPDTKKKKYFLKDAPNTDDLDADNYDSADAPNDNDNGAGLTDSKISHYSLIKRNQNFKNDHNTQKHLKASLMPPMVMPKQMVAIILMIPPILLIMILSPKTPKYPHIH